MKKPQPPTPVIQQRLMQYEPYWIYQSYTNQQGPFDQYCQINQKEIYTLQQQLQVGFLDNIKTVSQAINNLLHPCFNQLTSQDQFLRFNSVNVDWLTLKLIHLFINNSNLMALDFRYNNLTQQELEVVYQIFAHSRIVKAFIEYTPNVNLIKLSPLYNLEFIYLRGNEINNDAIIQFMNGLHNRVRVLELGINRIGWEACDSIAQYMGKPNALEYLGLAQNCIKQFSDIRLLSHSFGKNRLTTEEMAKITELEQQREAQIAKFQKQKKKYTEEMLIQVPPYTKIDNFHYTLLNPQFKLLNLSDNQIPEIDREHVDKFLNRLLESQTVVLTNNNLEHSTKAKLRKKYKKCVVI